MPLVATVAIYKVVTIFWGKPLASIFTPAVLFKQPGGNAIQREDHHFGQDDKSPMATASRSLNRCTLPVCVFGKASINLIARGYLYGAITALT
jgi:hypothetical protein